VSVANILVVDDEEDIRTLIEEILSEEGYRVLTAGDAAQARQQMSSEPPDLVLLDIWMPDTDGITLLREWTDQDDLNCPVVIMSGHGTVETAVEATRLGAADFIEKPLSIAKLLRTVTNALEKHQKSGTRQQRSMQPSMAGPVGKSQRMKDLRSQIEQLASHAVPVLIVGESGTGREAAARYLHAMSARCDGPFVCLVSAGVTAQNAANLLLGAETAAGVDSGYLEQANGGTLFVDELQDLCPEAQQLLNAVLDQGSFSRLGRAEPIPVDFRVIASIRPEVLAEPGRYGVRVELISLLSVMKLQIPALREYPEDVSELLRYFIDKLVDTSGLSFRRFSVAAQNRLRNYPWPGNIRELESLAQRLLITAKSEQISLEEVESELSPPTAQDVPLVKKDLLSLPLREAREQFEKAYLIEQLALCDGKVGQLAKRVGMERTHLYRKLRTLGVDFRQAGGGD